MELTKRRRNHVQRKSIQSTAELKQQIIQLYHSGKRKCDIIREYDIASSLLDRWIRQEGSTGSFREEDNRTPEQKN